MAMEKGATCLVFGKMYATFRKSCLLRQSGDCDYHWILATAVASSDIVIVHSHRYWPHDCKFQVYVRVYVYVAFVQTLSYDTFGILQIVNLPALCKIFNNKLIRVPFPNPHDIGLVMTEECG
jgi:hypothetical protein